MTVSNYSKIKVLHIMSGSGGGISSFIQNKAKSFKDTSIVFDVLTFDPVNESFKESIRETNGTIHFMQNPKEKGFTNFYKQVDKVIKDQPDDVIIHSHIQGYRMVPFYLIAKKNRVNRFIVHAHTDVDEAERKKSENRINRLLNRSLSIEKVSCGQKASLNIFGEKYVKKKQIMHIPNSIDPIVFLKRIDVKQKRIDVLGVDNSEKCIIGTIARFHRQKNHEFIIGVIEKLSNICPDFLWIFIGNGELEMRIKNLLHEKGLGEYALFLGHRNDVPELYKIMDIFALPSLYEGLPTVAIEAQAAGIKTFMSTAITKESDLGMGLVSFIPINDTNVWVKSIKENRTENIADKDMRKKQLELKKFTNDASAELYKAFLDQKLTHYEI